MERIPPFPENYVGPTHIQSGGVDSFGNPVGPGYPFEAHVEAPGPVAIDPDTLIDGTGQRIQQSLPENAGLSPAAIGTIAALVLPLLAIVYISIFVKLFTWMLLAFAGLRVVL